MEWHKQGADTDFEVDNKISGTVVYMQELYQTLSRFWEGLAGETTHGNIVVYAIISCLAAYIQLALPFLYLST